MSFWQERLWAFILFTVLFLYLGLEGYNRHENLPPTDWRSEIRADGAGYYVYLPIWFEYGYEANNFPENIDQDSGGGFSLQDTSGIVRTKYFCGTALVLSPFYLVWRYISDDDVFSESFNRMVSWSAAFIMAVSALLLFYVCRYKSGNFSALFSVYAGIFGTTAFYYTVQNPMWSHVWSFFTVSLLLYLLHKEWKKFPTARVMLLGLFSGVLVITRPTNALLLIPLFFFDPENRPGITIKNAGVFLTAFLLPLIPQFNYWQMLSGEWWHYSYNGEGFHRLSSPGIGRLLLEPMCGLFPWTPLFVVFSLLIFSKLSGNKIYRYTLFLVYGILIYLFASWSTVNFGTCGFGSRSFTELTPLFLPLLSSFMRRSYLGEHSKKWILCGLAVILCLSITGRLSGKFSHCYEQSRPYDFREYSRMMFPENTCHQNIIRKDNYIELIISRKKYFRSIEADLQIEGLSGSEQIRLEMSANKNSLVSQEGNFGNGKYKISLTIPHFKENPVVRLRLYASDSTTNLNACTIKAVAN